MSKIAESNANDQRETKLNEIEMEDVSAGADYSALLHPIENTKKFFHKISQPFRDYAEYTSKLPTYND
ncbi:MAG TPA: hypothetical protein K8W01_03355 [Methylorubrum populi]|uniref:Uncharacterized protein n=1 Tax=Methylorubrum populi TaxID=223967 RepID=A0A921DZV7_9HYPH|nr:hypothetical protein [Methylorubrum populi]